MPTVDNNMGSKFLFACYLQFYIKLIFFFRHIDFQHHVVREVRQDPNKALCVVLRQLNLGGEGSITAHLQLKAVSTHRAGGVIYLIRL